MKKERASKELSFAVQKSGTVIKFLSAAALAALTFGTPQAQATEINVTLDSIKPRVTAYLNSPTEHALTKSENSTVPDGAITLNIDGVKYYYTPSESEDAKLLRLMASYGNSALITTTDTSKAVYSYDGILYTYDTSKLPVSAYSLTESTSPSHYSVNIPEWNSESKQMVNKTYDMQLKDQGSGNESIYYKWSSVSGGDRKLVGGTADDHDLTAKGSTGTGDTDVYFKWSADTNGNRKLVGGTADDHDLVAKGSTGTGDTDVYFKWSADSNGNRKLVGGTADDHDLVAKYDSSSLHERITSGTDGQDVTGDFVGNPIGAIFNNTTIGDITGDFIGNYDDGPGGAIFNSGTIGDITGDFIGNYSNYGPGGAICNYATNATIGDITGDFIGNYSNDAPGGAIYNTATIGDITGDFIGNYSVNYFGGAIYNTATIGDITGDFIGNYASGSNYGGGAIYNTATIGDITGDFIGNYSNGNGASGGAIYNTGTNATIGDITGDFIGNYSNAQGGAIYNTGNINNITGDFIGNYSNAGGAISNGGTIDDITGDFIGNYSNAPGGAIYNTATIGNITGDFIGNYSNNAPGGAIYNQGTNATIGDITGDFIGNYSVNYFGGAIFNTATLGDITGDFIGNYSANYGGGAICNGMVNAYSGNAVLTLAGNTFSENYTKSGDTVTPNSVYNSGVINIKENATVTVNDGWQSFDNGTNAGKLVMGSGSTLNMNIGNGTLQEDSLGAITNNGTINATVDIDIAQNKADTIAVTSVTQDGTINIQGLNFINGSAQDIIDQNLVFQILDYKSDDEKMQLAIDNSAETLKVISETDAYSVNGLTKDTVWSDNFDVTKTTTTVKAVLETVTTQTTNDSIGVTVKTVDTSVSAGSIDTLKAINTFESTDERTFKASNSAEQYTVKDDIGTTSSGKLTVQGVTDGNTRSVLNFKENSTTAHSGFVLNNNNTELVLKNIEVKGADSLVKGNASTGVNVVLDNVKLDGSNGQGIQTAGNVEVKGNSLISDKIQVTGENSSVNVNGTDEVVLSSRISGTGSNNLNISNGTVNLNNGLQINGMNVNAENTTLNVQDGVSLAGLNAAFNGQNNLNVANENALNNLNPTFNNTTNLNIANNNIGTVAFGNMNLNGVLKIQADADLANKEMDKITASDVNIDGGEIQVEKINLLSPTTENSLSLMFTDNKDLAEEVYYKGENEISYSPIYKYDVTYNKNNNGGFFSFARHGISNGSSGFNPAVLSTPVLAQAGLMSTVNNTMNYAFEHSDGFTKLPSFERLGLINQNKYASNNNIASTDFNQNMNYTNAFYENRGAWLKPYTSFESIPLKNGPKVDAISFGTLAGFDTNFKHLRNDWNTVFTGYLGYTGAHLSYKGVSTMMNGGILGGTQTWYKGNFWTALTATAGAAVSDSSTMYGHEDSTSIIAGIGSKTGYNLEFSDGKFILQPILFMNYSMLKTFDYTNAAGVKIDAEPLHTIQLNPHVRFIANLNNGWQPYASVGMVWNILNETDVYANQCRLPEMHIKPYVEYGLGIQRLYNERFTGFGQAMVRNGGRNGVALTLGLRYTLGN